MDGVTLTPLKIITHPKGDVFHAMKASDNGFCGFGEAYFSFVDSGIVKGWKRHRKMILNLVVPIGAVRFVIYDDRIGSATNQMVQKVTLSTKEYQRLTVPPMVWMAFQGVGNEKNMLVNIANIRHEPNETDRKTIDEIPFSW